MRISSALLQGYAPLPGAADELVGEDGAMRPHWKQLIDGLSALGINGSVGALAFVPPTVGLGDTVASGPVADASKAASSTAMVSATPIAVVSVATGRCITLRTL